MDTIGKIKALVEAERYKEAFEILTSKDEIYALQIINELENKIKGDYYKDHAREYLYLLEHIVLKIDRKAFKNLYYKACLFALTSGHRNNAVHWTKQKLFEPHPTNTETLDKIITEALIKENNRNLEWEHLDLIEFLGKSGDKKVLTTLLNTLEIEKYRIYSLKALANYKDDYLFNEVSKFAKDSDSLIRKTSIHTLFAINREKSKPYLLEGLKDSSDDVKSIALNVIEQSKDLGYLVGLSEALSDQKSSGTIRRNVVKIIGVLQPQKVPTSIIYALSDSDHEIRGMAAWTIGEIKDTTAIKYLEPLLNDPEPLVSWSADEAILKIKSKC